MLRIVPGCLTAIHRRPSARVQWNVPYSTIPITALKALGESFSMRAMKFPAALFTSVSITPKGCRIPFPQPQARSRPPQNRGRPPRTRPRALPCRERPERFP